MRETTLGAWARIAASVALAWGVSACGGSGGDDQPATDAALDISQPDAGGDSAGADTTGGDTSADEGSPDGGPNDVQPGAQCPDGYATLTFAVDDTANQTYGPGELIWTGSFSYDEATRTLTYATSWLPNEGPYPTLFDDGPLSAGGHEAEGQTAGDHVWSVAVCYLADEDRLFAYGLLNEDLRWIWVGPNGQLEVPAGQTGVVDFPGMTIAPHGTVDFRVTLDTTALHPDYEGIDGSYGIYIKGTMNSWTPVQLLDAGILGDEVAGDGIVTYQQSLFLGKHDGLLRGGEQAQFVFVFAKGDTGPDDGLEYKVDGDAVTDGVAAEGLCGGAWTELAVTLELDSKGKSYNTTVTMCEDETPPCDDASNPCDEGYSCVDGACVPDATPCDDVSNPCDEGYSCADGACVPDTLPCDDVSNPCDEGYSCVNGDCVQDGPTPCDDVTNPCDQGYVCVSGNCVLEGGGPEIFLVIPATGPATGGTEVSISGQGFTDGATVDFGGEAATVTAVSATSIQVTTPPHAVGAVDVTVSLVDGKKATFPGGFTYVEAGSGPTVTAVTPDSGPTGGGTSVTVTGANFADGASVLFDAATASDVVVAADGLSLTCTTPAHPVGVVSVTVTNPDDQQATLADAFTYTAALPGWARLDGPAALGTVVGVPTGLLTAQVYAEGVTPGDGAGFGLDAEVGYGPAGSDPTDNPSWTWSAATYQGEIGNNDVYAGAIAAPEGTYSATLRFTISGGQSYLYADLDGSDNGFDPAALATVTVSPAGGLTLVSTSPGILSPAGSQAVTLLGAGFDAGCTLTFDGAQVADTAFVDGSTFTFTAPAHVPGDVEVALTCGADTASLTVPVQGAWDGLLGDWPDALKLATSAVPSDWGEANTLTDLYASTDGETLYIAVRGHTYGEFGANALSVYIDGDLGGGTNVSDTATITDTDGAVDDALGGALSFDIPGFGAEVACATLDGATYTPEANSGDPAAVAAGCRGLVTPTNLYWFLDAGVVSGADGVEIWLPLADLYGAPAGVSRTVGLNVRIGNGSGLVFSNQALPEGVSGVDNVVSTAAASLSFTY